MIRLYRSISYQEYTVIIWSNITFLYLFNFNENTLNTALSFRKVKLVQTLLILNAVFSASSGYLFWEREKCGQKEGSSGKKTKVFPGSIKSKANRCLLSFLGNLPGLAKR